MKSVCSIGRASLTYALAITFVCGLLPLVATGSATFLGKDVTSIAAGIIGFYPGVGAAEGLRVVGVALLSFFMMALPFAAVSARAGKWRWIVFPGLPLLAYALWWLGAVVKYPALYETLLPTRFMAFIFRLAFVLSPSFFYALAALTLCVPITIGFRKRRWTLSSSTGSSASGVVVAILVLVAADTGALRANSFSKPNVLLIAVDSLRSDRAMNSTVAPHLSELLTDPSTVSFSDHYVGIPRTFPSWIEMLTGRYAARTGIRHMFPGFGPRNDAFAGLVSELGNLGYRTSVTSDFAGDIFPRFDAGFDEVDAPRLTLMSMIRMSVDQMFPVFLPLMTTGVARSFFPAMKQSPAFGDPSHLGADVRKKISAAGDQPWLETVFFSTAHFPYAAPHPYYKMFAKSDYVGSYRFQKNPEGGGKPSAAPTEADVAQVRALYDGAVHAIDDELGTIFQDLKNRGLWDSTIIVITADHGEDLYENDLMQGHGEHLRGVNVLRVPFIMKLANGNRPSVKFYEKVSRSIDLASTILGATGEDKQIGDGTNLMPFVLSDQSLAPQLKAFAETGIWFARSGAGFFQQTRLDYPGISGLLSFDQGYTGEIVLNPLFERTIVNAKHRMMVDGDYKIIYMPTPRGVAYEYYNRRVDPENLHDVQLDDPDGFSAMRREILAFISEEEPQGTSIVDEFVVPP